MTARQKNPIVAMTLVVGVMISFALILLGIVEATVLHSSPAASPPLHDLLPGILRGNPAATISAGLVVLMLTPLARVVVLFIEFLRDREYSFAWITVVVLFLLIISFAISAGWVGGWV